MANQAEQGVFSPFLQRRRIAAAVPHLTGRVLDIGCGNGQLAAHVSPDRYLGVDRDAEALAAARTRFPKHRFVEGLPEKGSFDTVIALALIEHLPNPVADLKAWSAFLAPGGHMVLTTPHKMFRIVHDTGARVGLFSWDGAEEHEELFDRQSLAELAEKARLRLTLYRRFLGGANQLVILQALPVSD